MKRMEPTRLPGFTPLPTGNRQRSAVDLCPEDAAAVLAIAQQEAERTGGPLNVAVTIRMLVRGALVSHRSASAAA